MLIFAYTLAAGMGVQLISIQLLNAPLQGVNVFNVRVVFHSKLSYT